MQFNKMFEENGDLTIPGMIVICSIIFIMMLFGNIQFEFSDTVVMIGFALIGVFGGIQLEKTKNR